ncbi:hypothetical protein STPH2_1440 [Streptomyces sp. KO7888]|nr:hypothetical protein [Streptomyces sp. KO7888]
MPPLTCACDVRRPGLISHPFVTGDDRRPPDPLRRPAVRRRDHPDRPGPESPTHLEELYESLRTQEGVSLEWIIAPTGRRLTRTSYPGVSRRTVGSPRLPAQGPGPAPARNTTLNYVSAPRVAFVNDDDRNPPFSLAIRNEHAITTGLRWVAGRSAGWDPVSGSLRT